VTRRPPGRSKNPCPECATGRLDPVLITRRFRGVQLSNILADQCDRCGAISLSGEEVERISRVVDLKLAEREREKAA
jgi:hypothetical protein